MLEEWYWILFNAILFDNRLSDKQKLLSSFMSSLCSERWYCWATNKQIWDKLWVSPETISVNLSKLEKNWYIHIEIENWFDRKIYLGGVLKILKGGLEKSKEYNNINNIYITEFEKLLEKLTEEEKQKFNNELSIIQKMFKMWYKIKNTKQEIFESIERPKKMMSRFIPRNEMWKLDWNKAKWHIEDRYSYWKNPPKWKKPPTNCESNITNWMKNSTKPYKK